MWVSDDNYVIKVWDIIDYGTKEHVWDWEVSKGGRYLDLHIGYKSAQEAYDAAVQFVKTGVC